MQDQKKGRREKFGKGGFLKKNFHVSFISEKKLFAFTELSRELSRHPSLICKERFV